MARLVLLKNFLCCARVDFVNMENQEACPFTTCPDCQHVFCRKTSCEDGSTPSGGDWLIVCAAGGGDYLECAKERNCLSCKWVRSGDLGSGDHSRGGDHSKGLDGVCCKCRVGHPEGPHESGYGHNEFLQSSGYSDQQTKEIIEQIQNDEDIARRMQQEFDGRSRSLTDVDTHLHK